MFGEPDHEPDHRESPDPGDVAQLCIESLRCCGDPLTIALVVMFCRAFGELALRGSNDDRTAVAAGAIAGTGELIMAETGITVDQMNAVWDMLTTGTDPRKHVSFQAKNKTERRNDDGRKKRKTAARSKPATRSKRSDAPTKPRSSD